MTFADWLDQERGRATTIAARFGVTISAVSQWRTNGVPVENIIELHKIIGDDVPIEELIARPNRLESHQARA